MAIMNWVWPITALYWVPVALWFHLRRGKHKSRKWAHQHGTDVQRMSGDDDHPPGFVPFARKSWWPVSMGVSHCGAGCTLGDVVGEWTVYFTGFTIAIFAGSAPTS